MKATIFGLSIAIVLGFGVAYAACTIENAKDFQVGINKGVEGYCSNNRGRIRCTYQEGEGWTCEGPDGGFSALGAELTELLIAEACGC